jgi:D-alanine-D-alanine ligase
MKIGLAFDLKPSGESLTLTATDDGLEEYDPPETIEALAVSLEQLGHRVIMLGGGREFLERVLASSVDLVFNIAEGHGCHRSREAQVPGVLEMLGIPYVGSDPLTLALCLDKPSAKRIAQSGGVATPGFQVIETIDDLSLFRDLPLRFPLVVKPAFEGSSKGIHQTSRVEDFPALRRQACWVMDRYRQPALVEEFVPGVEVTVGVVGNRPPQVVAVMEVVPRGGPDENFMYTLEVKRNWRQMVGYRCPPDIPPEWLRRVQDSALKLYKLLGCRDMARIDFRIDRLGRPFFIEANPLPGLSPVYGDLPIMGGLSGWDYPRLVETILDSARQRYGLLFLDHAHRTAV